MITTDWLGKMIGLPSQFLHCGSGPGGGVIQVGVCVVVMGVSIIDWKLVNWK